MFGLDRGVTLAVLPLLVFSATQVRGQNHDQPRLRQPSFERTGHAVADNVFPLPPLTVRSLSPESDTLDRLHDPVLRRNLAMNGATSCAAASCHGGPQPGIASPEAVRGSEYQVWKENDPHARSWRTICTAESIQMMQRLKIMVGNDVVDSVGFQNCLACHNTDRDTSEPNSQAFHREGVGCAACHGPSERWIGQHYQDGWSALGATHEGFVESADLFVRARMCAACHIGDKDRDMNHDLIAAGHPPLRYEFSTYHARQPKHWRDAESSDVTYWEAQLWLAGQVASADASLSLLQTRALDAHSVSEWPEFAAYECASCHHELKLIDISDGKREGKTPGVPAYSQWNDAGLRWLIGYRQRMGETTAEDHELAHALKEVKAAMECSVSPDATRVARSAAMARTALAAWFDGAPGLSERTQFRSRRLGHVVVEAAESGDAFRSWESAVQFYLAAVAARQSWPNRHAGPVREIADQLRFGLRYPDQIEIGRYSKRDQSGPTLNQAGVRQLGTELAGWLQDTKASD